MNVMTPLVENIAANAWLPLIILNGYFENTGIEAAIFWFSVTASFIYATYLYRKRWAELKVNRPDLFMLLEERKKAMQESKGKE